MGCVSSDEVIEGVAAKAAELLSTKGIEKADALKFGKEIADSIAENWGGQLVYIPKSVSVAVARRNEELRAKFTGDNQAKLALEFDLSLSAVYRILKRDQKTKQRAEVNHRPPPNE